jgi:hypothetical protein
MEAVTRRCPHGAARRLQGLVEEREALQAGGMERQSLGGGRDRPRRPGEQGHLEHGFEAGDPPAHAALGLVQEGRRLRHAAEIDHRAEGPHVVEVSGEGFQMRNHVSPTSALSHPGEAAYLRFTEATPLPRRHPRSSP